MVPQKGYFSTSMAILPGRIITALQNEAAIVLAINIDGELAKSFKKHSPPYRNMNLRHGYRTRHFDAKCLIHCALVN